MKTNYTKNLIIGAGPAGLAMAGRFEKQGMPYIILEKSQRPGNAWHEHYERLCLHTVKKYSNLPYLPFPKEYPEYVPRALFAKYLHNYAIHFGITPKFGQTLTKIQQTKEGKWNAATEEGQTYTADNVVLATGVNRLLNPSKWKGMEGFQGDVRHSRFYKNATAYKGQRVLIIGMGNTGAELAIDLHENGATPFISIRNPVNIISREFLGRSYQHSAIMLEKLPHWLGDRLGQVAQKIAVGDLSKYGLPKPKLPPATELRLYNKTPVIDIGAVKLIKQGKISILPDIVEFKEKTILFSDNRELPFDSIILATGYLAQIQDFFPDLQLSLNRLGMPEDWHAPAYPGLYFLGYNEYNNGLLRGIQRVSAKIIQRIKD